MTNTAAVAQPFTSVDRSFTRKSSQRVIFTETFHVNGEVVQVVVDRDSYSDQSGARVSVLSGAAGARKWTVLASIGGADLAELVSSPYADARKVEMDATGVSLALIRRAVAILSV
jgi:MinD superfamily P-loop ATPase